MPACPYCREVISGRLGTFGICPFCSGRVWFYNPSPVRRSSMPPLRQRRQPVPRLLQLEIPPPAEHIKEVKIKPERKVLQPKSRPKQKPTASAFPQKPFYEVDEEAKTIIIIGLPIEEEAVEWKIENKVLKVKSPRLDFQYKEVIEIPKDWQAQEPKTKFVNGILAFQF